MCSSSARRAGVGKVAVVAILAVCVTGCTHVLTIDTRPAETRRLPVIGFGERRPSATARESHDRSDSALNRAQHFRDAPGHAKTLAATAIHDRLHVRQGDIDEALGHVIWFLYQANSNTYGWTRNQLLASATNLGGRAAFLRARSEVADGDGSFEAWDRYVAAVALGVELFDWSARTDRSTSREWAAQSGEWVAAAEVSFATPQCFDWFVTGEALGKLAELRESPEFWCLSRKTLEEARERCPTGLEPQIDRRVRELTVRMNAMGILNEDAAVDCPD